MLVARTRMSRLSTHHGRRLWLPYADRRSARQAITVEEFVVASGVDRQRILHVPGSAAWAVVCFLGLVVQPILGVAAVHEGGDALEILVNLMLMAQPVVAAVIISRVPANPIGWVLLVGAVGQQSGMLANRLSTTWPASGLVAGWLGVLEDLGFILFASSLAMLLLVFPTGSSVGRVGRVGIGATAIAGGLGLATALLAPFPPGSHPGAEHPVSWGALDSSSVLGGATAGVALAALCLGLLAGVGSMWKRWRVGDDRVRGQLTLMGWCVVVGIVVMLGLGLVDWYVDVPAGLQQLSPAPFVIGVPVGVGVAVLRHRLLDLRVLVNRTLTFAGLSIVLFSAYLGLVAAFGALLVGDSEVVPPVLGVGVVALVAHPAHQRIRSIADRRLFGDRSDPYLAVTRLQSAVGLHASAEEVARSAIQTITSILRVPHARLELSSGISVAGGDPGPPEVEIELRYGDRILGTLTVAARSNRERFTEEERLLVGQLGQQTAVALGAAELAAELSVAHGRLSAAVAEERHRLLRDLHDDLGPRLTGIGFTIEAARRNVDSASGTLLARAGAEMREAINRVRLIARDLRPPELDTHGLRGALRRAADRARSAGVDTTIDLPDEELSVRPEVEVAVLRIAEEALTNVVRHSVARHCTVRLRVGSDLELSIVDDGRGLAPGYVAGIGLQSMHERASRAGGSFSMGPARQGCGVEVHAAFPLGDQ